LPKKAKRKGDTGHRGAQSINQAVHSMQFLCRSFFFWSKEMALPGVTRRRVAWTPAGPGSSSARAWCSADGNGIFPAALLSPGTCPGFE